MRKSFHTLSGLVRNMIGGDPMNGDVYIFVNKRRNRIKLLHYETGGMVIYAKMLDRGTFGRPIPGSKDVVTSSIQWADLLKMVEGSRYHQRCAEKETPERVLPGYPSVREVDVRDGTPQFSKQPHREGHQLYASSAAAPEPLRERRPLLH